MINNHVQTLILLVVAIGLVFTVIFHVGVSEQQHVPSRRQRQQSECVRPPYGLYGYTPIPLYH